MNWLLVWAAICMVESGGDPRAYCAREDAAGIAQIRPIMVADCNRIVGEEQWTLDDRWSPDESREMFLTFCRHYKLDTPEKAARGWNGINASEQATRGYWLKVKAKMEAIENESTGGLSR